MNAHHVQSRLTIQGSKHILFIRCSYLYNPEHGLDPHSEHAGLHRSGEVKATHSKHFQDRCAFSDPCRELSNMSLHGCLLKRLELYERPHEDARVTHQHRRPLCNSVLPFNAMPGSGSFGHEALFTEHSRCCLTTKHPTNPGPTVYRLARHRAIAAITL